MDFKELVKKNRSYRRFDQSHSISKETLLELVEMARYCASGGNRQSLRFLCSCAPEWNRKIFDALAWAAYLPKWPGPSEGERPTGYIVILCDPSEWKWMMADLGIVAQTILLEAANIGLGGCMFGNINKKKLQKEFNISEPLEAILVIALGKPVEKVVIEDVPESGSIKYYRTEDGIHHVPKRSLQDILIEIYE
ncbi:MAG TPA: nitroreductase family protein [Deltaproteobacteria bacterium]|nr:nitroreductase family protein [Deltaproteobacteria bacterium]